MLVLVLLFGEAGEAGLGETTGGVLRLACKVRRFCSRKVVERDGFSVLGVGF